MTDKADKFRQHMLDVAQVRPDSAFYRSASSLLHYLKSYTQGIRFKLSCLIVFLLSFTAGGISLVVIGVMNDVQLQSMLQRGASIAHAAVIPAGHSILTADEFELDNLVASISNSQPDIEYLIITDNRNKVLAHNNQDLVSTTLPAATGTPIGNDMGFDVKKIHRNDSWTYEFRLPIEYYGNQVGYVIAGVNASIFTVAQKMATRKILLIILLLFPLAIAGAFLLSRLFTYPVEKLSEGVARIQSGEDRVIVPITSNDELAALTRNFNKMATKLAAQRQSLVNYSEELEQSYADIVKILAAALDARDNYTYGHSSRVSQLSVAVGRKLDLKPYELKELEMTCLLHDIGKINIPDNILNKPGKLDDDEYQHIKDHPYHGVQILDLTDSLKKYIPAVLHHHEWHDGTGYPGNLAGESIPLYSRILSIADAYDAMTSSRPYREGMSRENAIEELNLYKGRQFEPKLVDLFIETLDEYGDVCDIPLTQSAQ